MATTQQAKAKSYEDLETEIGQLRSDISKLSETLQKIVSSEVDTTKAKMRSGLDSAAQSAARRVGEARARVDASADEFEALVRDRPFASVLVALGAGFVVGSVVGSILRR